MKLTRLAISRADFISLPLKGRNGLVPDMRFAMVILSALALSSCGSGNAPSGQVVATVDGVEITQAELNAEMGDRRAPTAQQQKELQSAVLEQMIARTVLANAAKAQGLDDTPGAAMTKQRAEQAALISLLERKLGNATPRVSAEEVEQFILNNPEFFASRKIYIVDQLIVPSPPAALIQSLKNLEEFEAIKGEVAKYNLPTTTALGSIDTLTMAPEQAKQIAGLPSAGVFITPDARGIRVNHIRESQQSPVTGSNAESLAKNMLAQRRKGQQVQDAIGRILQEGRSKVKFNPDFRPAAAKPGKKND